MKVYLRRLSDRSYFAGDGNWCKARKTAKCYPFTAVALMDAMHISDRIEIVLVFDEESDRYELCLPGPTSRPTSP